MDATPETWRPVVGFEGAYEVSNLGRVRSLERIAPTAFGTRRVPPKIRVLVANSFGYDSIVLTKDGQRQSCVVHTLVLEAFVGPRPPGMEACHFDGDPRNNRLNNLRWDTKKANAADAVRAGARPPRIESRCRYGHDVAIEGIYIDPTTGSANCRKCRRLRCQKYRAAKKAAHQQKE